MSAWGNRDDIASPGTVTLTSNSSGHIVIGTGTFFANNYAAGDVVRFSNFGSGVIKSITNATHMLLVSNTEINTATITGANNYTVSELPIIVIEGDGTTLANTVFGVSVTEQVVDVATQQTAAENNRQIANTAAHAGWVKIGALYTDANGNVRRKNETLVAMSTITGDADDDTTLPDS